MKMLKLTHERGEEKSTKEDQDLISELPDEVLCSILSLLPIKDRVKTSILSSRWRYQYASMPCLEFHIYTMNERIINPMSAAVGNKLAIRDEEGLQVVNSEFVRYVSKILELYRGPKIHSFMVSYSFDQVTSCHLDRWIEFAITKGVESLKIILLYPPYLRVWEWIPITHSKILLYTFPCFLLSPTGRKTKSSTNLKHLQLELCILDVPPASFNGFRNLVTLDLQDVKVVMNENCCQGSLFSSCLLLEVLSMRRCILPANLEAVEPFVKNLKCLEVFGCYGVKNILVSAMKLTTFVYNGRGLLNLSLQHVPKLNRLHIKCSGGAMHIIIPFVLTQLPKDLPEFESLFVYSTIQIRRKPALMLASFVNLKELELEAFPLVITNTTTYRQRPSLLWIASAIDALPLLLKLHVMLDSDGSSLGFREERKMKTSGFPHNQLKEVLITGFNPYLYQMELVICLLKNAVALERMTIDPKERYYCTDSGKMELVSCILTPPDWDERETKFYEALHREIPGSASLVTVCNH